MSPPTLAPPRAPEAPPVPVGRRPAPRAMRYAVVIGWALFVGINLASTQLFPRTAADLPDRGPALLIEPVGAAFAIWGPIFAGLGATALYQALPGQAADPRFAAARPPLLVSFGCGALWPAAVGYDHTVVAAGLLFGMLGAGALAYRRLVTPRPDAAPAPLAERAAMRWPLGLYLGWLSLAAVLSVATVATADFGVRPDALGLPEVAWTGLGIGLAATCGVAMGVRRADVAYAAAITWGLAGIAAKPQPPAVLGAVGVAIAAIVAGVGFGLWRARRPG